MGLGTNSVKPSLRNISRAPLTVFAVSAITGSGAREMFRSEGFTEFVPKPIERTVLERVLRRVLPNRFIQYAEGPVEEAAPENSVQAAPEPAEAPAPVPEAPAPEEAATEIGRASCRERVYHDV